MNKVTKYELHYKNQSIAFPTLLALQSYIEEFDKAFPNAKVYDCCKVYKIDIYDVEK